MAATTGLQVLGTTPSPTLRKLDISKELILIEKDSTVFTSILEGYALGAKIAGLPPEKVSTSDGGVFTHYEEDILPMFTTATAEHNAAVTDITVGDGSIFNYGTEIRIDRNGAFGDGEIMILDQHPAVGTPNTINVQERGAQGTMARTIAMGARVTIIGQLTPEFGTSRGLFRGIVPGKTPVTNVCQLFEAILEQSFRKAGAESIFGFTWPRDAKNTFMRLRKETEAALFAQGTYDLTTTDAGGGGTLGATGTPKRYSFTGLEGWIQTHRHGCGMNLTWDLYREIMGYIVRSNPGGRQNWVQLAAQRPISHIASWGKDYIQTSVTDDVFGYSATRVKVPTVNQQEIPWFYCPLLDLLDENAAYLVDLSNVRLRYLQGGPPKGQNWNIDAQDQNGLSIADPDSTDDVAAFRWCIAPEWQVERNFAKLYAVAPVVM